MTEAMPWKSKSNPKALVRLSKPSKSTRTTEVNPTYAPEVIPKTAQNMAVVQKSQQKLLKAIAEITVLYLIS